MVRTALSPVRFADVTAPFCWRQLAPSTPIAGFQTSRAALEIESRKSRTYTRPASPLPPFRHGGFHTWGNAYVGSAFLPPATARHRDVGEDISLVGRWPSGSKKQAARHPPTLRCAER